jgi:type VI secretion system secreted protein VgrG
MFDPVNEPSFRLDVAGLPDPSRCWPLPVVSISEPFAFDIDLLIDDLQLDLAGLLVPLGVPAFRPRHNGLSGQLQSVVQHEHEAGGLSSDAGTEASCLALRFSQRIFSSQCVPQILAQVLKEHGIAGAQRRFDLHGEYPVRTFCTQYRESDLQFVQRLCAQARIHYYFEHRPDGHCLVFVDDPGKVSAGGGASVDDDANSPAVRRWQMQVDASDVERLARPGKAHGHSDLPTLRSARWLALSEHPFAECNRRWLLNRIEHRADPASEPPTATGFASAQAPLPCRRALLHHRACTVCNGPGW